MWVCMCVGVRGGGPEGYVFCCDNLYYGFFSFNSFNPIRLLIIISLNAFDGALMFLLLNFFLMSLSS